MIISQERWDKTFKNFEVYDCTYGFEHGRVGLLLIEKIDENHIEYGNDYYMPKHKLVSIVIDNWICPYISRHLLSLNPSLAHCRRYSRGER